MRSFLLCLLLFVTTLSYGQINQNGLPIIRNFTPDEYDAHDQNWCAVQDNRGVMYFGNNHLILEYDGRSWRTISIPNNTPVRSLAVDSLGTVYVGVDGDFGYLSPSPSGELQFKSLVNLITDSIGAIYAIQKIHCFNNKIYFFTRSLLFIYDGNSITTVQVNLDRKFFNLYSFVVNNRYYIGSYTTGLRELIDTSLVLAPNGDVFKNRNIWGMIPASETSAIVVTATLSEDRTLYHYNQVTGECIPLEYNDKFFQKTYETGDPYNAIALNDSTLGLAFIYSELYGFVQLDKQGKPITVLNKTNGLLDENVVNAFQNNTQGSAPVWLPLTVGISRASIHSPISRFSEESGIKGGIIGVTEFENRLIVLTVLGAYYQDFDKNGLPTFKQIPQISSSAWSHIIFQDPKTGEKRLLIGTPHNGIFEVDKRFNVKNISQAPQFADFKHVAYSLCQSQTNPDIVYIGMTGIIAAMKWENGRWKNLGKILPNELKQEYREIVSAKPNELWLLTYKDGITRVRFGKDTVVDVFGIDHGLHTTKDITSLKINDRIYFATSGGVVEFNEELNKFVPALLPGLTNVIDNSGVYRIVKYNNGYALARYIEGGARWVEIIESSTENTVGQPFKVLPQRWCDFLFVDSKETLWMGISTELYSYNKNISFNYNEPFNAHIRKVVSNGDSVLFYGSFFTEIPDGNRVVSLKQSEKQKPTLSFIYNNLKFEVSSSFYENETQTEYSWKLLGYEKDWTRWTTTPMPIYTNLSEGSYTFMVKARNIYGVESSIAEYSFSITPPWYRSILAIIFYVILLGFIIYAIVAYNTRRLIEEKIRLEQIVKERTAEVVAQKEELEKQRDKIFDQNEEIKSSISYASRIQSALLTPKETIDEIFKDYFILFLPRDIVSGDFYWHTQIGSRKICVISDCTGHGVPGGFMSMLGIAFLTQIMAKGDRLSASQILDQLREMIIASLHQTGKSGESKDGMDLALYIIDTDTGTLEFAGANNPLVVIRDNEIIQIKGDKMPIGIHIKCDAPFTNNIMEYKKGDVVYTFSDGFADQFGGPDQRKFMIRNLKDLFLAIHKRPMEDQRSILLDTLMTWQGDTPRIDDIVVMGLRL